MRALLAQSAPVPGDVEANLARAELDYPTLARADLPVRILTPNSVANRGA